MDKEIRKQIDLAAEQFREMLAEQYERNERMAAGEEAGAAAGKMKTIIGLAPGDGIGPVIMDETKDVLERLLADEIAWALWLPQLCVEIIFSSNSSQ